MKPAERYHLSPLMQWVLRIGLASTFAGHGYYAINQHPGWTVYLDWLQFTPTSTGTLLFVIGILDVLVACFLIIRPNRYVYAWAVFWILSISIVRPLTGESVFEIIKRGGYLACAVALWLSAIDNRNVVSQNSLKGNTNTN
ncbi:MAG: hypothetical protein LAT76_09450 [Schleiferiaceae bacterium]|nr:hypothetical protein [Schleiferiaceae bacterium]